MSRIKLISLSMVMIFVSMATIAFADADKAYEHIYLKMDQYNSGSTLRLIESYSYPYPPGQQYNAWVYDNALAIIALLARKTPDDIQRARLLCDTLMWVQNHDQTFTDGRIRDAYWANNINTAGHASTKDPNSSAGNSAWVIIAWMDYYMNSGDTDATFLNNILQASIRLGNFIEAEYRDPDLGYLIGYAGWEPNQIKLNIKSTEHNIDLYAAFSLLSQVTGDTGWQGRAEWARRFVAETMWNTEQQYFYPAAEKINAAWQVVNNVAVCDNSALAQLAFIGNDTFLGALDWANNQFANCHDGFCGFDFGFNFDPAGDNGKADGVWFEGTAQMALAYLRATNFSDYNFYLGELQKAQTLGLHTNGKGIISACHGTCDGCDGNFLPVPPVSTGFKDYAYYASLSLASTSWYIFAEKAHNPYSFVTINRPPVLNSIGYPSIYVGSPYGFMIEAVDPDNDSITYSVRNLPSGANFSTSSYAGFFEWTPTTSQIGTYSVTFIATDSHGVSDSETVVITVKTPETSGNRCSCFVAGTPILMADGSLKPIEKVKVKDAVLAFDEKTGKLKEDIVKEFFKHKANEYLIVNGHLKVTPNHPVYSDGKWVEIGKLKIGDNLLTSKGNLEKITSIKEVKKKVNVYNLEVNPYHTYIAGGIVVHNKDNKCARRAVPAY